jgi:ATP phosphoribosyltransferase
MINIALPKGRLGDKAYAIFESAGYGCPAIYEESRKLMFENSEIGVRYFWVKPSDVAIYVERGAADIGVVGKDILLEYSPEVYELLDFGIGKCRMCVAAEKGFNSGKHDRTLRVATKFPNIARDYYEKQGRIIDIIKLNGSIEIAPLLGLSDVIVDIVETGKTLLENNLEPIEKITDISARLISNKVSYKFNHEAISKLCDKIAANLEER